MQKCEEIIDSVNYYFRHYECYDPFEMIDVFDELYQATGERDFKDEIDFICREDRICPVCHKAYLDELSDKSKKKKDYQINHLKLFCGKCGYSTEESTLYY